MNTLRKSPIHAGCRFWPGLLFAIVLAYLWGMPVPGRAGEPDHREIMRALRDAEEHVDVWQRYPLAGIPLLTEAPVIDGRVDRREWFGAARIGYMLEMASGEGVEEPSVILLGYTQERLYMAFQFARPANALRPDPRQDYFELAFDPDHGHRRFINAAFGIEGLIWDGIGPGLNRAAWSGDWEYAARETEFGWEGELSVPFSDFGLEGPPPSGTIWGADFIRNERTPVDRIAQWSFRGTHWSNVGNLGHLVFLGQPLAVRVEGIGWLDDSGEAGMRLLLVNSGTEDITVSTELFLYEEVRPSPLGFYRGIDSAMAEEEAAAIGSPLANEVANALEHYEVRLEKREPVTVPAGRSLLVPLTQADIPGTYLAGYAVRAGEALLAGGMLPFEVSVPLAIQLTSYLFSAETLAYEIDLRRIRELLEPGSRLVAVARDDEGRELARAETVAIGEQDRVEGILAFAPTPGRTVRIHAHVFTGDDLVAENAVPLRIPEKPVWLGHPVGRSERVPPPWIPLEADTTGARTLAITYDWRANQLLPGFTVFDRDILAAPPAFEFTDTSGRVLPFERTAWRLESQTIEEAVYAFEGIVGNTARISGRVRVEFDGLVWFELETETRGELGGAHLRLALKPEYALLYTANRPNQARAGLPDDGVVMPFNPSPWLGGMEGGVQFLAENPRHWHNVDEEAVIRMRPTGDRVEFSVAFVDRPVPAGRRLEWSFGLMPTPNRVLSAGWENYNFMQHVGTPQLDLPDPAETDELTFQKALEEAGSKYRDKNVGAVILFSRWNELFGYPGTFEPERAQRLRNFVQAMHSVDIKVLVYAGWGVSTQAPEWADFGSELITLPVRNSGYGTFRQEPASLYSDLFVYRVAEMIREFNIDGIYSDSQAAVTKSFNYGGPRWIDDHGEVRGSYPILAYRDLYKRLYKVFHGEVMENGIHYCHQSGPANMAVESFVDVRCPAEFVQMYEGEFDTDFLHTFMAGMSAQQHGLFAEVTNKNWMDSARKMVTQLYALAMPLNVHVKAIAIFSPWIPQDSYALNAQPMPRIWAAQSWLGIETAEYLPWWRNAEYLSTNPADEQVLTALWLHRGEKALLSVSNLFREPRQIEARLNLEQLGFSGLRAEDAITGEIIEVHGDRIPLEIDFERFRLLKLTPANGGR
jgi:hypothetical protein